VEAAILMKEAASELTTKAAMQIRYLDAVKGIS